MRQRAGAAVVSALMAVSLVGCTARPPRHAAASPGLSSGRASPVSPVSPAMVRPPRGLRGEAPATAVVRRAGWRSILRGPVVGQAEVGGAQWDSALTHGSPGDPWSWSLNPDGARLTAYHSFSLRHYHPEGPGTIPDICTRRWTTVWRWNAPNGKLRRWVSAAPASEVVPTEHGFLTLANRIGDYCRGRSAPGLTGGDLPWWYLDARGNRHHLRWRARPTAVDSRVGPLVCGRNNSGGATRYCTFDRRTLSLSPLTLPPRAVPIAVDGVGRTWAQTPFSTDSQHWLLWTNPRTGNGWHRRRLHQYVGCQQGGSTVLCDGARTIDISTDGGVSWSRQRVRDVVDKIPHRLDPGSVSLDTVVAADGSVVGLLSDAGNAAAAAVQRPPGPHQLFRLLPLSQPRSQLHEFATVSIDAGLVMVGRLFAPHPHISRRTRGVPGVGLARQRSDLAPGQIGVWASPPVV